MKETIDNNTENLTTESRGSYQDNLIGIKYNLVQVNAAELSNYLKSSMMANGIDFKSFNSIKYCSETESQTESHPPLEIYEYQNFFLLRRKNNKLVLMDGFRRLLWYTAPNISINVRIYDEKDLTNQQILTLLVHLNHFKFFGNNNEYHERGFALLLRTVFGLTINNYRMAFDGYLSGSSHSPMSTKNMTVKDRITDEHFVDDIRFIERLNENGVVTCFSMGSLVYNKRKQTNIVFDADAFLCLHSNNKLLRTLIERNTSDSKVLRQIIEIYSNLMDVLGGKEVERTNSEILADYKAEAEAFRKNKEWTKMTGSGSNRQIEAIMKKRTEQNHPILFKCMIYPNPNYDIKDGLQHGMTDMVEFKEWVEKKFNLKPDYNYYYPIIGIKGTKFDVGHNTGYSSFTSHVTKEYAWIGTHGISRHSYNVDLFVNISKKELMDAKAEQRR